MIPGPEIVKPEIGVGALVSHQGRLLLIQRGRLVEAHRWAVPGGRVRRGERLSAAVVREVAEETGLAVEVGDLLYVAEIFLPAAHFVVLDYAARLISPAERARPGSDAEAIAWVSASDLPHYPLAAEMSACLEDIRVRRHLQWA